MIILKQFCFDARFLASFQPLPQHTTQLINKILLSEHKAKKKKSCLFVHDQPTLILKIRKKVFTVQKNIDPNFHINFPETSFSHSELSHFKLEQIRHFNSLDI